MNGKWEGGDSKYVINRCSSLYFLAIGNRSLKRFQLISFLEIKSPGQFPTSIPVCLRPMILGSQRTSLPVHKAESPSVGDRSF